MEFGAIGIIAVLISGLVAALFAVFAIVRTWIYLRRSRGWSGSRAGLAAALAGIIALYFGGWIFIALASGWRATAALLAGRHRPGTTAA